MSTRMWIFGAVVTPLVALAQVGQDTARTATSSLAIRSDADSSTVFLDGILRGRTPLTVDSLREGTHVVRILPPDSSSWLFDSVTDTVRVAGGERKELFYRLIYRLMINSMPSGATLVAHDSVLGTTPLLVKREDVTPGFVLRKEGYESVTLSVSAVRGGSVIVPLMKSRAGSPEDALAAAKESGRNWLPVYLSGGGAVLSGTLAATWKIAADNKDQAYRVSGDPQLARDRDRLDRASAFATAVMEVCVVYFVYRLLSE